MNNGTAPNTSIPSNVISVGNCPGITSNIAPLQSTIYTSSQPYKK